MDKFTAFTDLHLRLSPPSSRRENDFLALGLGKLRHVLSVTREIGAKATLFSGDLFDRPDASTKVITGVQKVKADYPDIDLIVVPGNHDSWGEYADSYEDTALGVLANGGSVKVLTNAGSIDFEHTRVSGFGWAEETTQQLLDGDLEVDGELNRIGLIHATVGGPNYPIAQNITEQNVIGVDLALFGDVHDGFDEYTFANGSRSVSAGSLCRMKVNEDHIPGFLVIESSERGIKYKKFTVPHTPHAEAFIASIADQADAEGFLEYIKVAKEQSGESVEEFVYSMCDKYMYPRSIGDVILENLR